MISELSEEKKFVWVKPVLSKTDVSSKILLVLNPNFDR